MQILSKYIVFIKKKKIRPSTCVFNNFHRLPSSTCLWRPFHRFRNLSQWPQKYYQVHGLAVGRQLKGVFSGGTVPREAKKAHVSAE